MLVAMTDRPMHIPQRRYDLRAMLGQLLAIYRYAELEEMTGIPATTLRHWRIKPTPHPSWVYTDVLVRFYVHVYGEDRLRALESAEW